MHILALGICCKNGGQFLLGRLWCLMSAYVFSFLCNFTHFYPAASLNINCESLLLLIGPDTSSTINTKTTSVHILKTFLHFIKFCAHFMFLPFSYTTIISQFCTVTCIYATTNDSAEEACSSHVCSCFSGPLQVCSLQQMCRLAVRQYLGQPLIPALEKLSVPHCIKKYLTYGTL